MSATLGNLKEALLAYLDRYCRGPARARKVWKVAEDLRILGVETTEPSVRAALLRLRADGHHVRTTNGELPATYLATKPKHRRQSWPPGRDRGKARSVRTARKGGFTRSTSASARADQAKERKPLGTSGEVINRDGKRNSRHYR